MSIADQYGKALKAWAKAFAAEHVDETVNRLIYLAKMDLHFGPYPASGEEEADDWKDWKGFEDACLQIKAALQDLPSDLYIDIAADDCWQTSEPEGEDCDECEDGKNANGERCVMCGGDGFIAPHDDWYHCERRELKVALVGKELADYV
jgi:hypothetical protein